MISWYVYTQQLLVNLLVVLAYICIYSYIIYYYIYYFILKQIILHSYDDMMGKNNFKEDCTVASWTAIPRWFDFFREYFRTDILELLGKWRYLQTNPNACGMGKKDAKRWKMGMDMILKWWNDWTLYWCLVSTSFFGLRLTAWTCERAHPKPYPRYERKLLQYKSRVEAELQQASGRESELEIKLKAKNQDRSRSQRSDIEWHRSSATWPQECDRLGQESLKTKDLQEKVLALQVGNVDLGWIWMGTFIATKSNRFTCVSLGYIRTKFLLGGTVSRMCLIPFLAFETVYFEKVWNDFG